MSVSILDLECIRTSDKKVSLDTSLIDASEYSGLDEASPVYRFAIQRFQLALLRRALRGPETVEQWKKIWEKENFDKKAIKEYLKEWGSHFDLFDPKHPFLQNAGLRGEDEKPVAYLASALPADTNIAHFTHAYDATTGLSPAALAKGMLAIPIFATAGGRGIPAGINDVPPVYFMPVGENYFQTLLMNLPIAPAPEKDAPAWEGKRTSSGPIGFCEGLTWMPRQILLGALAPGSCALSGASEHGVVRRMVYKAGRSRSEERDRAWLDPHVRIQTEKKKPLPLRAPNPQVSPDRFESFWRTQVQTILDAFEPHAETPPALCQLASLLRDGVIIMDTIRIEVVALHSDGKAKLFGSTNKLWAFPASLLLEKEKRDGVRALLIELETRVERLAWSTAKHRYEAITLSGKAGLRAHIEAAAEQLFMHWLSEPKPGIEWIEEALLREAGMAPREEIKKEYESSQAQRAFIQELFALNEGDKSRLRSLLGRNPCLEVNAGKIFTDIFWPLRQKKFEQDDGKKEWHGFDREACWIVATLFAFNELPGGGISGVDVGHAMRRINSWGFRNEPEKKRAERRFKEMLKMDRAELVLPLAQLVRFLRKHDVPVDWTRMLVDLSDWNRAGDLVQKRWAREAGLWS